MFSGCQKKDNANKSDMEESIIFENNEEDYNYFESDNLRFNEKLIYNIYKENLGIYNTDSCEWNAIYNQNNLFAYSVNDELTNDSFYSIGSSAYNKFSVVQQDGTIVNSIMDVEQNDSCIPIGTYNDRKYFIYNENDLSENETRKIVYLDSDQFIDVYDLKDKLVTNAVFVSDELFYVYYVENEDMYYLYSYNIETGNNSFIKTIYTDKIYRLGDEIVYIDKNNHLKNVDDKTLMTLDDNVELRILPDNDMALEIYINKDSDVECKIIKISNGKVIDTAKKFYGYVIENEQLDMYCEGQVVNINLKDYAEGK
jgi:hypothetical protein